MRYFLLVPLAHASKKNIKNQRNAMGTYSGAITLAFFN